MMRNNAGDMNRGEGQAEKFRVKKLKDGWRYTTQRYIKEQIVITCLCLQSSHFGIDSSELSGERVDLLRKLVHHSL